MFTHGNIFIKGGWTCCASPPDYGGGTGDIYVDSAYAFTSICGMGQCAAFWQDNVTNHTAAGSRQQAAGSGKRPTPGAPVYSAVCD